MKKDTISLVKGSSQQLQVILVKVSSQNAIQIENIVYYLSVSFMYCWQEVKNEQTDFQCNVTTNNP